MLYSGNGTQVRMPSATAIKRYANEHGGTFDVPVEIQGPGGSMQGWVRVTRRGGQWHVTTANAGESDLHDNTSEAVKAILEARRPTRALASTPGLVERARARRVGMTPLQDVNSSWIRAVGYQDATGTLVVDTGRDTYGYSVPRSTYTALLESTSPGSAYNATVRNRAQRAQKCDECGRFYGASGHRCPGPTLEHHPRSASPGSRASVRPVATPAEPATSNAPPAPSPAPQSAVTEHEVTQPAATGEPDVASRRSLEGVSIDERLNESSIGRAALRRTENNVVATVPGTYTRRGLIERIEAGQHDQLIEQLNLHDRGLSAGDLAETLYSFNAYAYRAGLRCDRCGQFTRSGPAHSDCPAGDIAEISGLSRRRYSVTLRDNSTARLEVQNITGLRSAVRQNAAAKLTTFSYNGEQVTAVVNGRQRSGTFTVHPASEVPTPNEIEATEGLQQLLNATRITGRRRTSRNRAEARDSVRSQDSAQTAVGPNPYLENWAPESSWADSDDGWERFEATYVAARERRRSGEQVVPYREESLTGNPNATFGIELEVVGIRDGAALARDLHDAGLTRQRRVMGYMASHDVSNDQWKLTTDASLSSYDSGGSGYEVPTRAIPDTAEGWEEFRKGLEIIRRHGGHVNTSCGGHLNLGLRGTGFGSTDPTPYSNMVGEYHRAADTVTRFSQNPVTKDHRAASGNRYAPPNQPVPPAGYTSPVQAARDNPKYSAVNLSNATPNAGNAQRVEFRMFDGVNAEDDNTGSLSPEEWSRRQAGVWQARFLMAHGMAHAAARASQAEDPAERRAPQTATPEPLGTRRRRFARRNLQGAEFRESTTSMLSHLDRWVPDDAAKAQLTALWATTSNQGSRT